MSEGKIVLLPCNGLDKVLGAVAGRAAVFAGESDPTISIACPVLLNHGDEKQEKLVKDARVICINGCMTRCATSLAEEKNVSPWKQVLVASMVKKLGLKPGKSLALDENGVELAKAIANEILSMSKEDSTTRGDAGSSAGLSQEEIGLEHQVGEITYNEMERDKFKFRVPSSGYLFNENDCWVKPDDNGTRAYIGISDFLQNKAGDVMFVDLPEVGMEFEQFDEVGSFESVKTVLDVISPVSGRVVAVNKSLVDEPEKINQDPYVSGWFALVELDGFEEDKELLLDCDEYFELMKKKIEEEARKLRDA